MTALLLMLPAAAASAQLLTLDGSTAVQSFDGHRKLVVVDSDGDGRADHLFRLWSERLLPRIDKAFVHAHMEFEPHRLRIIIANRELCLALGNLPSEETALAGYGLNHEWGGTKVALHRIVIEGDGARYEREPGAADWPD